MAAFCSLTMRPAAAAEQLPNLTPFPASDIHIQTSGGRTFLRFTTSSWNNGAGRLELVAGKIDRTTKKQRVYQRIYSSGSSYRDVMAGNFVWHEAHAHFHFEGYATYILKPVSVSGPAEKIAQKTSFCVRDNRAVDTELPGAPKRRHYPTCGAKIQGISPGWSDIYEYKLEGQAIDITGLPSGEYNLRVVIDPGNRIIESNEKDNVSDVRVPIKNGRALVASR
jgi:hypothetical protein